MRLKDMMKAVIPQEDRLYRLHTIKRKSTNEFIEELKCAYCGGEVLLVETEWYESSNPKELLLEIHYTCKDKLQADCSKIFEEELVLIFEEEKTKQEPELEELVTTNGAIRGEKDTLDKYKREIVLPMKVLRRLVNGETVEFNNIHLHYIRPMKVKAEDRIANRSRIINFSIDKDLEAVTTQELQLLFENLSSKILQELLLSLEKKSLEQLLRKNGWQLELK